MNSMGEDRCRVDQRSSMGCQRMGDVGTMENWIDNGSIATRNKLGCSNSRLGDLSESLGVVNLGRGAMQSSKSFRLHQTPHLLARTGNRLVRGLSSSSCSYQRSSTNQYLGSS